MKFIAVTEQPELKYSRARLSDVKKIIANVNNKIKTSFTEQPQIIIGFISKYYSSHYEYVSSQVMAVLKPKLFIGCSAEDIVSSGMEVKDAMTFLIANLDEVQVNVFHINDSDLPDEDASPMAWEELIKVKASDKPKFLLFPEPFSSSADYLVKGLDYAYPNCVKVGGIPSGGYDPQEIALFYNDQVFYEGILGITLVGNLSIDTILAHSYKPIGKSYVITKADRNYLYELNNQNALTVVKDLLTSLNENERELSKKSMLIGILGNEFKTDIASDDFLIRELVGLEINHGALVVGEFLQTGKTIQFHVNDSALAIEDLRFKLNNYRKTHNLDSDQTAALIFSCLSRKDNYGYNQDGSYFKDYFKNIPLIGFFGNGEIAPTENQTFVHGYTTLICIIKKEGQ